MNRRFFLRQMLNAGLAAAVLPSKWVRNATGVLVPRGTVERIGVWKKETVTARYEFNKDHGMVKSEILVGEERFPTLIEAAAAIATRRGQKLLPGKQVVIEEFAVKSHTEFETEFETEQWSNKPGMVVVAVRINYNDIEVAEENIMPALPPA